jgi:hypothetical protein
MGSTTVFVGLYTLQVVAWVWPPVRFVAPLIPLLLWYAWRGLPNHRTLRAAVLVMLIVVVARGTYASTERVVRLGSPLPGPNLRPDNWQDYRRLLDWVRTHTPEDAVVGANLDPDVFLFSGRHAIRPFHYAPYELIYKGGPQIFRLGTPTEFVQWLQQFRIDYLILTPNLTGEAAQLAKLIAFVETEQPRVFVRHEMGMPGYVVYQVDRSSLRAPAWAVP